MTVAPTHWVAYGKVARKFFVEFVKRALELDFEAKEQSDIGQDGVTAEQATEDSEEVEQAEKVSDQEAEVEGEILPGEGRGNDQSWNSAVERRRAPWFVFVVPHMEAFRQAKIQLEATKDADFRWALTHARFFVMELPPRAQIPAHEASHGRLDETPLRGVPK
jgi:hypothetical protein